MFLSTVSCSHPLISDRVSVINNDSIIIMGYYVDPVMEGTTRAEPNMPVQFLL